MDKVIYFFCALTSAMCGFMLLREYSRSRSRLVLWGGIGFVLLAAANAVMFIDFVLTPPEIDLRLIRLSISLAAVMFLLFGLIWETV